MVYDLGCEYAGARSYAIYSVWLAFGHATRRISGQNGRQVTMLTRPPSLPSCSSRSANQLQTHEHGYILLFALGLMAVLATLVLSVTVTLRLDAQLLSREKTALQEVYLLRGAAQYTALQLGITSAVTTLSPPLSNEARRQWILWRPNEQTYEANLGSAKVRVELEDISGLPDANMLSLQEWERLFLLLGSSTPETAKGLATKVMEMREQLMRTRNTTGFSSIEELLEWREISVEMVHGQTKKNPLGLKHLVVVGTRNKRVDLNSTPMPLLQVLGNVTSEHLQRLATLRRVGTITTVQAQQWLQGTGLTALTPDASPAAVKARLSMATSQPQGQTLVAVFVKENGDYSVVDQMIDKDITGH